MWVCSSIHFGAQSLHLQGRHCDSKVLLLCSCSASYPISGSLFVFQGGVSNPRTVSRQGRSPASSTSQSAVSQASRSNFAASDLLQPLVSASMEGGDAQRWGSSSASRAGSQGESSGGGSSRVFLVLFFSVLGLVCVLTKPRPPRVSPFCVNDTGFVENSAPSLADMYRRPSRGETTSVERRHRNVSTLHTPSQDGGDQ